MERITYDDKFGACPWNKPTTDESRYFPYGHETSCRREDQWPMDGGWQRGTSWLGEQQPVSDGLEAETTTTTTTMTTTI